VEVDVVVGEAVVIVVAADVVMDTGAVVVEGVEAETEAVAVEVEVETGAVAVEVAVEVQKSGFSGKEWFI
jgi:hypothetical protein